MYLASSRLILSITYWHMLHPTIMSPPSASPTICVIGIWCLHLHVPWFAIHRFVPYLIRSAPLAVIIFNFAVTFVGICVHF